MDVQTKEIPKTIDEAVELVIKELKPEDRGFILNNPPSLIHHTAGRNMRNNWGLWDNPEQSPLKKDAVEKYKLAHADDISGLIYEMVWAKIRGKTFDADAYCKELEDHWMNSAGKTALQAGGVNKPS